MNPSFDVELLKSYPLIVEFVYLWSVLLDLYNIWAIFLYVIYVFEIFFVYENLCVDTVNLIVPMDLSGIPRIFIYLLFMRGSLTCYITRPHFCGCVCDMLKPMVTWVQLVYHIFFKTKKI
jgi:hypothetical protein